MDKWLFIRLLTKIPTKLRSTILKKISWAAYKPFIVSLSLSLMLKSSPLFKIFRKKTSEEIGADKPLLIKQNECIFIGKTNKKYLYIVKSIRFYTSVVPRHYLRKYGIYFLVKIG